jgi:hypothetical protein
MMWASAYVQNRKEVVRMDAAMEAGIMAAEGVLKLVPAADQSAGAPAARDFVATWAKDTDRGPRRLFPWLCAPVRLLDRAFWSCGLSHPANLCGGSGVALVLVLCLFCIYIPARSFR